MAAPNPAVNQRGKVTTDIAENVTSMVFSGKVLFCCSGFGICVFYHLMHNFRLIVYFEMQELYNMAAWRGRLTPEPLKEIVKRQMDRLSLDTPGRVI